MKKVYSIQFHIDIVEGGAQVTSKKIKAFFFFLSLSIFATFDLIVDERMFTDTKKET